MEEIDNTYRCVQCATAQVGTVLVHVVIRMRVNSGPTIPVAHVLKCVKCGYIAKRWMEYGHHIDMEEGGKEYIAPTHERYKITKAMVAKCLSQANYDTFTLEELQSGVVTGDHKHRPKMLGANPMPEYNPNKFIEPAEPKEPVLLF